jgi:ProP effector
MTTTSNPIPASSARALLKTLQENFLTFRNCLPLAIGIDKQILARMPELDRTILRATLAMHTKSSPYLRQVAKASSRFDLDGNASGEVNDVHRQHASTLLQNRTVKAAEFRTAQRELERKAKLDAEQAAAAQKQVEKLNQLLTKFSKH